MELLKNPNFDFLSKTRFFVTLSSVVILSGIGVMVARGIRYGVEFSGGTQMVVKFQKPPEIDRIRTAVEKDAPGAVIQTYDDPSRNQVLIRLASAGEGEGEHLGASAEKAKAALASSYAENPVLESSSEIVGPVVGAELRQTAIQLTVWGLLFQLIYIAVRFGGAIWGTAAALAALHDVLITMAFLAFFKYEITLNVIAALLTLVGYSVNDTIVIFDRTRENIRQRRKDPLARVVNDSINQTLTRTLISNGTTFLAVFGLFLFGGEVLSSFGFTMVVGIIVGTYSTIYIASPIVVEWQGRNRPGTGATAAKAAM